MREISMLISRVTRLTFHTFQSEHPLLGPLGVPHKLGPLGFLGRSVSLTSLESSL